MLNELHDQTPVSLPSTKLNTKVMKVNETKKKKRNHSNKSIVKNPSLLTLFPAALEKLQHVIQEHQTEEPCPIPEVQLNRT